MSTSISVSHLRTHSDRDRHQPTDAPMVLVVWMGQMMKDTDDNYEQVLSRFMESIKVLCQTSWKYFSCALQTPKKTN